MIPLQAKQAETEFVEISFGRWNKPENLSAIEEIESWEVRILHLNGNKRAELVKQISHISFTKLVDLWLQRNNIDSIEILTLIDMPHILQLYLTSNNISSLAVLKKAYWPQLSLLSIYDNYMRTQKQLTQGHFPKLERLWVSNIWARDKNNFVDLCFSKLETQAARKLRIQATRLGIERSIKKVLEKKWREDSID